jgi:hypothetical protein
MLPHGPRRLIREREVSMLPTWTVGDAVTNISGGTTKFMATATFSGADLGSHLQQGISCIECK